ncbi:MAG: protein kinase domain-containing protein [Longimicrobiales bacterium]
MTLAPCPQCGTRTAPGLACANCGTPTPAPISADVAAPSPDLGQWNVILQKLQRIAAPKYIVKSVLGYGGMAGVYLAEEPRLGRKVAIKVMAPALMIDHRLVERFMQEARTIAQLSHPNIVTIYEVDQREDLHWFTMTLVGGRTLGQVMVDATEPLPIEVVRAWLYQIGDALSFAHQHGIVHRDIKPGNVLLDLRGNALVTDFGIAKVADADAGLTRTGMLVGTPAYMSPEQCSSGAVTGASDQYSLGAVAYQMLTGQPPFAGPTLSVLHAHVAQEPTPLRAVRSDCPDDLASAVERMLQKRPEDRWPSISAAITAAQAAPPGLDGLVRMQLELLAAQSAALTVSAWSNTVGEGTRQQLQVFVLDETGRVLPNRRVAWGTSSPQVAAVTAEHQLEAFSPGATQISAASGAATTTLALGVRPEAVRAVDIQPMRAALRVAETASLEAIVLDLDGTRLEDRAVLWTSSDPAVAQVSRDGIVQGQSAGHATITATSGGQSATTSITVTPGRIAAHEQPALAAPRSAAQIKQPASTAHAFTTARTAAPPTPRKTTTDLPRRRWILAASLVGLMAAAAVAFIALRPWQRAASDAADNPTAGTAPPLVQSPPATTTVDQPVSSAVPASTTTQVDSPLSVGRASPPPTTSRQSDPPQVPTQPQPATVEATVQIQGDLPEGASITVTDAFNRARAVAGRTIRLDPGTYAFEFRAPGYEPDRRTITLRSRGNETWTPVIRTAAPPAAQQPQPTTPTTQPARDARLDQAAIETEVRNFVVALDAKNHNAVLPLLLGESRDGWRHLLTHRDVQNFRALLSNVDAARVEGSAASVQFTLNVSYRNQGENIAEKLNWMATLDRTATGWRLTLARPLRN